MNKAPAFQFYAADFLADEGVILMSMAARGIYITLLAFQWREGSIPSEFPLLAKLCGCHTDVIESHWQELKMRFVPHPENPRRLINVTLENQRIAMEEYRKMRANAGTKGATARWRGHSNRNGRAKKVPIPKDGSSSSSAAANNTEITDVISVGDKAKKPRGSRLPEVYELTDEMIDYAKASAPDISVSLEHEKFCNYWHAKAGRDATKIDWTATWKNWMLNAQQWAGSKKGNQAVLDEAASYYQEWGRTGVQPRGNRKKSDDEIIVESGEWLAEYEREFNTRNGVGDPEPSNNAEPVGEEPIVSNGGRMSFLEFKQSTEKNNDQ